MAAGHADDQTGAKLISGDDKRYGYLTLTIDAQHITGTYTAVDKAGAVHANADHFQYSATAQSLSGKGSVSL